MKRHRSAARLLIAALSLLFVPACSSGGGGDSPSGSSRTGSIEILATDAPFDATLIERAVVDVVKVRMNKATDENTKSGWITIFDGGPISVDLNGLRNGITQAFANGDLPVGSYSQLRIHLSGGELELKNGNVYSSGDGTLKLPSASTSGYKVFLDPPVEISDGGREQIVLDFALSKTFSPVPANNAETATSFKLHPNIRAAVMSISGKMQVVVRRDDGTGTLVGVPDATVHVLPAGELDLANAIATSITDGTGSATILGLYPTAYDVVAEEGGVQARVDGLDVVTGEATLSEVVLP